MPTFSNKGRGMPKGSKDTCCLECIMLHDFRFFFHSQIRQIGAYILYSVRFFNVFFYVLHSYSHAGFVERKTICLRCRPRPYREGLSCVIIVFSVHHFSMPMDRGGLGVIGPNCLIHGCYTFSATCCEGSPTNLLQHAVPVFTQIPGLVP